jgi:hypothetical protein
LNVLFRVSCWNFTEICFIYEINDRRRSRENDKFGRPCLYSERFGRAAGSDTSMDFIRGASLSEGGKPIIALESVTGRGESKIAPFLKQGAGVVTTRAHVHYVVTEYGAAVNLYGKTLRQRARELIRIAHPAHREEPERQAFERFKMPV